MKRFWIVLTIITILAFPAYADVSIGGGIIPGLTSASSVAITGGTVSGLTSLGTKASASMLATQGTINLLTNGDFATNDLTGWTAAAGWSAETGKAVHTAGIADTTPLVQAVTLADNSMYAVTLTRSSGGSGTVTLTLGTLDGSYDAGWIAGHPTGSYGTVTVTFWNTTAGAVNLTLTPTATFDGSIDDISVKLISPNTDSILTAKDSAGSSVIETRVDSTSRSMAMGYLSGRYANVAGRYTAFGYEAVENNTTGMATGFGIYACRGNTTGKCTGVGYNAGSHNTIGMVTSVGYDSGVNNTTGSVVALGYDAAHSNTVNNITAVGQSAGYNSTADGNSFFGYEAGYATTTGKVTAFGNKAARYNQTGEITAFGNSAARTAVTGVITAMGYQSAYTANGGSVTALGYQAAISVSSGSLTAIGHQAGYTSSTGVGSVFLGAYAGYYETGNNKLFIDNAPRASEADARTKALIYGVFAASRANQTLDFNAATSSYSSTVRSDSGGLKRQYAEAVSAALSGSSGSIAVNVPAGSRILGVQLRVDTAITSGDGATSWAAAYVNTPTTAICSGQAFTKSTKYKALHAAYELTTDVVTITITPNSGTFSAGVVRAIVYYEALDAMADAL